MTSEQAIAYIAAALVHLEEFSLPKVGTFKKVYLPAKIVPQKKVIIPPITKFELERGERKTETFIRFLVNEYGLREEEARNITEDLGQFVSSYVASVGNLEIPGIGNIVKAGQYFRFKNYVSSEGLMLEPVSFKTIQVSGREIKNKTKQRKKEGGATLKKIGIFAGITLGTLIIFSGLLYGILYKQFYPVFGIKIGFLHKLHKLDQANKVKKKAKLFATTETADSTSADSSAITSSETETSKNETDEKIIEDVKNSAEEKNEQESSSKTETETPAPAPSIFDNVLDPDNISGPKYFVIVASSNDKGKVESIYKKFQNKGYSPKLIKHPKLDGWYRVAISEHSDKASADRTRKKAKALGVKDAWVWTIK